MLIYWERRNTLLTSRKILLLSVYKPREMLKPYFRLCLYLFSLTLRPSLFVFGTPPAHATASYKLFAVAFTSSAVFTGEWEFCGSFQLGWAQFMAGLTLTEDACEHFHPLCAIFKNVIGFILVGSLIFFRSFGFGICNVIQISNLSLFVINKRKYWLAYKEFNYRNK